MIFSADKEEVEITVDYHKSWGMHQIFEKIQNYGEPQNYHYAFALDRFDDTNFFPAHDIAIAEGITTGRYMFYNANGITDTKVEIIANSNNINYAFYKSGLVTIRKLTVYETTEFTSAFSNCTALTEIRIGGTIGQNISFNDSSKLSNESVDSIIEHLKDLTDATAKTLTVHKNVYNRMAERGVDALITAKNWTLVKA